MIVAARLLSETDFGIYTYNTAVFAIALPFVFFGLNGVLVRTLLDAKDTALVVRNALIVRGTSFAFAALFVWWVAMLNDKLSLLLIIGLFGGVFQVFESFNQAFHHNHITAAVRIVVSTVFITIKGYLLWSGTASIDGMLLVFVSEFLIYFFIGFAVSLGLPRGASLVRLSEMKALAAGGIFLLFSGFAEILNLRVDQLMIAEMVGTAEVGQYAIAARIVEFPVMFGAVVASAYFPKFYSGSSDPITMFARLRRFNLVMACFATVFVVFLFFLGPMLVRFVFGSQYDQAAEIVLYLLPCIYILFFRIVISKWILATGLYWYSLFSHTIGAITNIALNFVLIPAMGLYGAVLASIISYAVGCWVALLFNRRTRSYLVNAYVS